MPRKWYKLILAAGLSAICVLGCSKKTDTKAPTKPVPVTTLAVTPEDVPEWHEVMGQTEGADQVEIRSQVSGILKRQLYKEGEFVRRGQTLFVIDQAPFQADLEAARAAANQAKAQLEQADRELARTRRLYAQQAVPQKDLDDAQSTAKVARAALKAAEAKAASSAISLSHTQITAPADGIAGMALVNPGALVTAQSTQLTTLTQKKDLKVVFAISDRDSGTPR